MKKNIYYALFLIFSLQLFAKQLPEMPNPPRLVNDFANILSVQDAQLLEQKLRIFNDSSSTQIVIVTENSIEDDDVFDYSYRLAQKWGIGQKGKNNGVLIYAAIAERKIRIQVGYGLEGVLTDAASKKIIEELIKPAFKQKNYITGFEQAANRIIAITKGEYKADAKAEKDGINPAFLILIFIIIFVVLSLFNKGGGGRTYSSSGSDWWTAAMVGSAMSGGGRSRGGSSWGDFSSGGGSFGGFGGGSFGGGGAGGDW